MSLGALVLAAVSVGAGGAVDPFAVPFLAAVMFASGWVGRDWWLTREVDARREVIRAELPVAIDLMTLAIVAGESVGAACARVPRFVGGEVGTELARVAADIRAGAPAVESLERLAARVPEHAMGRFVDALCTGLERGAPLGDVLRAQADDLREERKRDLLEMGGRREVLMLVPVIFLIMPVVVVFALLPGLVSLDLLVP
jgi:tight adherence protein C